MNIENTHPVNTLVVDLDEFKHLINLELSQEKVYEIWNETAKVAFENAQYIFHEQNMIIILDEAADSLFNGALLFIESIVPERTQSNISNDNLHIFTIDENLKNKLSGLHCLRLNDITVNSNRLALVKGDDIYITQEFYDKLSPAFRTIVS